MKGAFPAIQHLFKGFTNPALIRLESFTPPSSESAGGPGLNKLTEGQRSQEQLDGAVTKPLHLDREIPAHKVAAL